MIDKQNGYFLIEDDDLLKKSNTIWDNLWNNKKDKNVQNMFKRVDLQNRFRIFLTGCKSFVTIKILVTLLVPDLTSNTKNYSMFSTKNGFF